MSDLKKKLEARHVNMIAIGGSIGTGIFLTSGYSIFVGGPGGALLAYAIMALIVYFLMTSLGEMSTYKPSSGSFCDYSNLYVNKSFGFAMGYNYWFNWTITIAAEISAASLIMNYWYPHVSPVWFSLIFFCSIFLCNIFSVNIYGEVEYWLSFIKVAVIIIFILLGIMTIYQQPQFGSERFHIGDAPFHMGLLGFINVFLFAGFSFQGTELVGVASGETHDPEKSIPRAIKLVFWRLTLFYIISIAIISLLINYYDPKLASQNNIHMSPYTLVFAKYIGNIAANIINLVILIALISAANASMYSSTRILWYLSETKQAPKFINKVTHKGVPLFALLITSLVGSIVFISSLVGNGIVFTYLVQVSSLCGFIAWYGIAYSHYCFRKNILPKLGGESILKYRAKFYPYIQIISMVVILLIIFAQFLTLSKDYSLTDFIMLYSSVILFILLYVGHKLYVKYQKVQ
jgi:lysine-specific permease